MMKLELEPEEQQFLREILEQHHHELLWELARTDRSSFKASLRDQLLMLERLMEKVEVVELTVK